MTIMSVSHFFSSDTNLVMTGVRGGHDCRWTNLDLTSHRGDICYCQHTAAVVNVNFDPFTPVPLLNNTFSFSPSMIRLEILG